MIPNDEEYTCGKCANNYEISLRNGREGDGPQFCPYCGSDDVHAGGWEDEIL